MKNKYQKLDDVETGILLQSKKNKDFAQIAKNITSLKAEEITDSKIQYKIFYFYNDKVGYSILAYQNRLILISRGLGELGGYASSFNIIKKDNKAILYYVYAMPSKYLIGKYILGENKAEFPYAYEKLPISLRSAWRNRER
jgi:hypothetical protein